MCVELHKKASLLYCSHTCRHWLCIVLHLETFNLHNGNVGIAFENNLKSVAFPDFRRACLWAGLVEATETTEQGSAFRE